MTDEMLLIREMVTRGLIWLRPDGWWFAGYGEVQDPEPVPTRFVPLIERSLEAIPDVSG